MSTPRVCVAVPVKDAERYLPETLESILAQENVDLELLVLDNGSTDSTLDIAGSYRQRDERVRIVRNEHDYDYYGSLNHGLELTEADYYVPFAGDDLMLPGNLQRKVEVLDATGAGLAHSSAARIDGEGRVIGLACDLRHVPDLSEAPSFFQLTAPVNQVNCQAVVVRRSAMLEIGGFDARTLYAGDWLSWMRIGLRHLVVSLSDVLVARRDHALTGTAAAGATGKPAHHVPATLEVLFRDPAMPAEWQALKPQMMATALMSVAAALHADNLHRLADRWCAYACVGRALSYLPDNPDIRQAYNRLLEGAGLEPQRFPTELLALVPDRAEDQDALLAELDRLRPLYTRVVLTAAPERVDRIVADLGRWFETAGIDATLVPLADPTELLRPPRLLLAPFGAPEIAAAESRAVAAFPYLIPDLFANRPDPERKQAVIPDNCL